MTNQLFEFRTEMDRSHIGPLAQYIDGFVKVLLECGYSRFTIKYRIRLIGLLSRWMQTRDVGINYLDEAINTQFLQYLATKRRIQCNDDPALRHLLQYFREIDVTPVPTPNVDTSYLGHIERDFANYLAQERRLSNASLANYLPVARRFLEEQFVTDSISLEKISHTDISQFVLHHVHKYSRARVKLMVTALRSLFRFLFLHGDISTDLGPVVPKMAGWRFTSLPKWIPAAQVELLLRSCDQSTVTGQRNYVILLLLARLGLRSREVVTMRLDDIDWEAAEITVGGKSRRQDRLPLPNDVGEALARYLRYGRPRCSTRRVFVRRRAPLRGFSNSSAIYSLVRRAFDQAGISPSQKGPHILRHSLATNMLRKGASLGEIGEILRHRDLATTQIYAKVDLETLRRIAQPWPGGEE